MKRYPWKFKLSKGIIEWYQTEQTLGSDRYGYYFMWGFQTKQDRQGLREFVVKPISYEKYWYDCPHVVLRLFFSICLGARHILKCLKIFGVS